MISILIFEACFIGKTETCLKSNYFRQANKISIFDIFIIMTFNFYAKNENIKNKC